jgi:lipopolysaccharide transport system permease protein
MAVLLRAGYKNAIITTDGDRPELRFDLEGDAGLDGYSVSYQIFEPVTGVLLVEGERAPAGGSRFLLPLTLPKDDGKYQLYASLMHENHGWAYANGLPFVLADVRVNGGALHVDRIEVTDLNRVRRRRRLNAVPYALTQPFRTVWRNRSLSATLVRREILSRSRGSFGGALWTILNPLLLMITYFYVFGIVLKARFANDPSPASFALYFLAGMLPWIAFSEAVGRAPGVLIEYRSLIKKLVFPIETLPVNLVFSGLVGEAFGLALFTLACLVIRHRLPWTLIYLPLLVIPQMIFTAGLCWFLSALGAFLRDLTQIIGFVLTVWFFITPICYPETQAPGAARALLTKNPIYILVRGYRAIFLESRAPDWRSLGAFTAVSIVLAVLGHAWFYKLRKTFVDVL